MKKVININIRGSIFTIEEDAHAALEKYLNQITTYFKKYQDKEEIIEDIETGIAEKLTDELAKRKSAVVTHKLVTQIIESMGTVKDISQELTDDDEAETEDEDGYMPKRFYRDTEHKVIAGVASGIAAYFDIDPIIVRIVFILTAMVNGLGIYAYLIFWMATEEATTAAQKLEMQGKHVTIKNIEEKVRTEIGKIQVDQEKIRSSANEIAGVGRQMGQNLAKNSRTILYPIARVLGFLFIFSGALALAAICIATMSLLLGIPGLQHLPNFTFLGSLQVPSLTWFLGGIFLVVGIPIMTVITLGASLFQNRNIFTLGNTVGMFVMWMLGIGMLVVTMLRATPELLTSATEIESAFERRIDEQTSTRSYSVSAFREIAVSDDIAVNIKLADTYDVNATAITADLDSIRVETLGDTLSISRDTNIRAWNWCIFCHTRRPSVSISMPTITGIDLRGASSATIVGTQALDRLTVKAVDAAEIEIAVATASLDLQASDAARATIMGEHTALLLDLTKAARVTLDAITADRVQLSISDAAIVNASGSTDMLELTANTTAKTLLRDLTAREAEVHLSGISKAVVYVTDMITGTVADTASLEHYGDSITSIESTGNASVQSY